MNTTKLCAVVTTSLLAVSIHAQDRRPTSSGSPKPPTIAVQPVAESEPVPDKSGPYDNLPPFGGVADLHFTVEPGMLTASVRASEAPFFAMVLLSTFSETVQYRMDLPPILAEFVVMGVGSNPKADGAPVEIVLKHKGWPGKFLLFGQAVALDTFGLSASGIVRIQHSL